ncbi:MAG: hypothetical protein H6736_18875 [Alphaproteobacteria bacterium]|nr:hypothetical protein [Alphaproteobacteria bacterium]
MLLALLAACPTPGIPAFIEIRQEVLLVLPHDQGPPLETPFGPLSRRASNALCASAHVRIVRVVGLGTFSMEERCGDGAVCGSTHDTVVRTRDEAVLVGPSGGSEDFLLPRGSPAPPVGARVAMAYDRITNPDAVATEYPDGTPLVRAAFAVDPALPLPSQATLVSALRTFCAGLP